MRVLGSLSANLRSGDSYGLVLALLLSALVLGIVAPEETWGRVVRDGMIAASVVVAYWTATARRAFLVPRVVVPSIALVLVVFGAFEGATTEAVAACIGTGLSAGLAVLIARDLFDRRRVDAQTVLGALSLYVLLGFMFAALFSLVAATDDASFFTNGGDGGEGDRLYFSFVSITTTGFGDLAPAGGVGQALVVLEIVLGQLYLVTVVAVLVAAAMRRELTHGERADPHDR